MNDNKINVESNSNTQYGNRDSNISVTLKTAPFRV